MDYQLEQAYSMTVRNIRQRDLNKCQQEILYKALSEVKDPRERLHMKLEAEKRKRSKKNSKKL